VKAHTVLICGGRRFNDRQRLNDIMRTFRPKPELIIVGGATGADELGLRWAIDNEVNCEVYPARWTEHGRSAGPRRNERMIREGKPDAVVAMPGGRGTSDLVRRATREGVVVVGVLNVSVMVSGN